MADIAEKANTAFASKEKKVTEYDKYLQNITNTEKNMEKNIRDYNVGTGTLDYFCSTLKEAASVENYSIPSPVYSKLTVKGIYAHKLQYYQ